MKSCSEIVKELLDSKPYMQDSLAEGIINYSALARQLLPVVQQQAKRASLEAIMVAVRRYAEAMPEASVSKEISDMLRRSSLTLKNNMVNATMKRNNASLECVHDMMKDINLDAGEIFYVVEGSELSLIFDKVNLPVFRRIAREYNVRAVKDNMALITLKHPSKATETPGFYYFVLGHIARQGINIPNMLDTTEEVMFLVDTKDASRAYQILEKLTKG